MLEGLQAVPTTRRRCTSRVALFSDMSATLTTCRFDNDDDDDRSADIFGCKKRCAQKWKHSDQSLNPRSRERNAAISKGRGGRVVPMPAHLDEVIFQKHSMI